MKGKRESGRRGEGRTEGRHKINEKMDKRVRNDNYWREERDRKKEKKVNNEKLGQKYEKRGIGKKR